MRGADQARGRDTLPAAVRSHLDALARSLEDGQGDNLASLVVYGSAVRGGYDEKSSDIDVVVVLRDTARDRLVACSNPLLLARHAGRVEAIVLKLAEIAQACDVFPLLYDDIQSCHVLLSGTDAFAGLAISDVHRRLRIEQELREARIRMRRAVVDAMGVEAALAGALERKVKQMRSPLHALLRLRGTPCEDALERVILEAGRVYSIDTGPLLRVARDPQLAHTAFRALMDAAIDDVEALDKAAAS